jgi:hypothetical protein
MLLKASILSAALVVLMACSTEDSLPPDPYVGCCGAEPVKFQLNGNLIFIPNMFTPTGDGFNEVFRPFFHKNKTTLEKMVIKSRENNNILFTVLENDIQNPLWGWSGEISQDSTYKGGFNYEIIFRDLISGTKKTVNGSACSIACQDGDPKIPIANRNQCFFPAHFINDSIEVKFPWYLEVDCLQP